MIFFQILSRIALRAMTSTKCVAANKFDRNDHATFKTLWRNPQFWKTFLVELSLRIKRLNNKWLAESKCLIKQSHNFKHHPKQCFWHSANKFGSAFPKDRNMFHADDWYLN